MANLELERISQSNETKQLDSLLAQGKYKEALRLFSSLLQHTPVPARRLPVRNPQHQSTTIMTPILHINKGLALRSLGKYKAALEAFEDAIEVIDEFVDNGDQQETKRVLAKAYNHKGEVQHLMGRFAESIESYDSAIAADPTNGMYYHNRGVSLLSLRTSDTLNRALENFDEAIHLDPKLSLSYIAKGLILFLQQKEENLSEFFDKAMRADVISVSGMSAPQPCLIYLASIYLSSPEDVQRSPKAYLQFLLSSCMDVALQSGNWRLSLDRISLDENQYLGKGTTAQVYLGGCY